MKPKRPGCSPLGNPIANRPDPVRVAEEMAWLDCLCGGRLEMGLVKGAPYEIAPANSNPGKADAALLGSARPYPQGNVYHHRPVLLGRRVLPARRQHLAAAIQQPTPPVWMTGMSVETGALYC